MNSESPTCLFTGELLSPETIQEHTIPRSLCGRFRSNRVVSTSFNNAAGEALDRHLYDSFALIINELAPLLSSEHQPGNILIDHLEEGIFEVTPGGVLSRTDFEISERDPKTNKPTRASGSLEAAKKLAKQLKSNLVELPSTPAASTTVARKRLCVLSPDIELAALKACLLTFDHLLDNSEESFTRSPGVVPVLNQIRDTVLHGRSPPGSFLSTHVWGVEYGLATVINEFVRPNRTTPASPFEHILLAVANVGTRTLDLIWSVFGFEVYRFRVTNDWRGSEFTFAATCGVLKDTGPSGLIYINRPFRMGAQTCEASTTTSQLVDSSGNWIPPSSPPVAAIAKNRDRMQSEARLLSLEESDMAVKQMLIFTAQEIAPANEWACLIVSVRRAAERIYAVNSRNDSIAEHLQATLDRWISSVPANRSEDSIHREGTERQRIDWTFWITLFRRILQDLKHSLGIPMVQYSYINDEVLLENR